MVLADSFYKMVDGTRVWVNPRAVTLERDSKGQIMQAIETATGDTLIHAGMSKMSKSKNNGVDPQEAIGQYGADTVRLFAIFAAPPEQTLEWIDSGVQGAHRFLNRLWRAVFAVQQAGFGAPRPDHWTDAAQTLRRKTHQTLAKVTDDYGRRMTFNTAIAAIMELLNDVTRFTVQDEATTEQWALREALEHMVLMLQPVAPHIAQQLWEALGHVELIVNARWPQVDESALQSDRLTYVVQVNGKVRARIEVAADASKAQVEQAAMTAENVQRFIAEQTLQRVIVVPGKLVNIVVQP
jgi:leucyl-tRNA synthetase